MRKKICFVTTVSATIKAFLLDFAQYLVENCDFDVTFICGRDESMFEFTSEHVHYIPIKMKRGFSTDGFSVVIQLYRIFRKEKFDIVQYSTRNAATYGSIAAKMAGVKCRLYCQWGMMFVAMKGLKRVILKMDEKLICLLSNVIEVESHSMYDDAIRYEIYTPEKASIIWNGSACGVDLDKYLVQNKPLWRKEIREKYGVEDTAETKRYDRFLASIQEGSRYRFRVVLNPVISKLEGGAKRGKVMPHVTEAHQMKYFASRADKWGFNIVPLGYQDAEGNELLNCKIVERAWVSLSRNKTRINLSKVTYEGVLKVINEKKFSETLTKGIGKKKAYGFGLMTVIPI